MKTFVWKVSSKDTSMASFRYRCLMPFRWMKELDLNSRHVIAGNCDLFYIDKSISGIIFVKSFSNADVAHARKAHSLKIPIYIDLCDNFFHRIKSGQYNNENEKELLENIYKNYHYISSVATSIITTGTELAAQIVEDSPALKSKILIIPDAIENFLDQKFFNEYRSNPGIYSFSKKDTLLSLTKNLHRLIIRKEAYLYVFRRISMKLFPLKNKTLSQGTKTENKNGNDTTNIPQLIQLSEKKILWFGNAGIENLFGITDILIVKDVLIEIQKEMPITLIVCSNNKSLYDKYIKPLPLKTEYFGWSLEKNAALLKACDLVIVPNPSNPFTIGKSANRTLLALECKKPVVASYTPALKSIENLVLFDDWKKNILDSLQSNRLFQERWESNWSRTANLYSSKSNAQLWLTLFKKNLHMS